MNLSLETPRTRLRPFAVADAAFALRLLNEPSFLQHIGDKGVRTETEAIAYLENGPLASYARHGHGLMAVVLKGTGEPIGMCGLLKREAFEDADLGYAFLPEFGGQGYAIEAARAMMDYARQVLSRARIIALVSLDNAPSIRLLEKLAFRFEKRMAMYEGEPEVALYIWSIH